MLPPSTGNWTHNTDHHWIFHWMLIQIGHRGLCYLADLKLKFVSCTTSHLKIMSGVNSVLKCQIWSYRGKLDWETLWCVTVRRPVMKRDENRTDESESEIVRYILNLQRRDRKTCCHTLETMVTNGLMLNSRVQAKLRKTVGRYT